MQYLKNISYFLEVISVRRKVEKKYVEIIIKRKMGYHIGRIGFIRVRSAILGKTSLAILVHLSRYPASNSGRNEFSPGRASYWMRHNSVIKNAESNTLENN